MECLVVSGLLDVQDGDDVLMVEITEKLHLTKRSKTEHRMIKRGDLLDGNLLARRLVHSGTIAL